MKHPYRSGIGLALSLALMAYGTLSFAADPAVNNIQFNALQNKLNAMQQAITKLSQRVKTLEMQLAKQQEPQRFDVSLKGTHVLGAKAAKLGIVEFADFQCPYCRRFYKETFPQLKKQVLDTGKASFMVRNFPLDFHAHALRAAIAVDCVAQQDTAAYWKMQKSLFDSPEKLGDTFFAQLARQYGLNEKVYRACIADPAQKQRVQEDLRYAQTLGVNGTPTFFVGTVKNGTLTNAVRFEGAQPFGVFTQVLDYVTNHQAVASDTHSD